MSKKVRRVPVSLDAGEIKDFPQEDIRMILRGADELISTGGRCMLAKILKGSKDKKIFEYKLNECPAYGYYHDMKLADIMHYIDWMIDENYLQIKYDGRLPLLVFSDQGWEIEKETYAQELYQQFCLDVKENNPRPSPRRPCRTVRSIASACPSSRSSARCRPSGLAWFSSTSLP